MKTGKRRLRLAALCILLALGLLLAGAGCPAVGEGLQQTPLVLQVEGGGSVTLSRTGGGYRLCAVSGDGRTLYSGYTSAKKPAWQAEIPGVGLVLVRVAPGGEMQQLVLA